MKKCLLLFTACVFLFAASPLQTAAAADEPHWLWVPYAVNQDGYWTGLHIVAEYFDEDLTMDVSGPSSWTGSYAVPLNSRARWTGFPQNLLSNPAQFQSSSLLIFKSVRGPFTVTQFVGHRDGGFGFQTYHSAPGTDLESGWPHK